MLSAAIALATGALVATVSTPPAGATGSQSSTTRVGGAPRIPQGAKRLHRLSPSTRIHIDVVIQPRDPSALASFAQSVSDPASPLYRHYLTEPQFSAEFAPTQSEIDSVRRALVSDGLQPARISNNHLVIPVTASTAQLSAAFATNIDQYTLPSGQVAYANTSAPEVPIGVAPFVEGVVGLDDLYHPQPQALSVTEPTSNIAPGKAAPAVQTGGPQPCVSATDVENEVPSGGAYTADEIASGYGLSDLYGAGDFGAGQTVALYELQGYLPTDITAFQDCYGTDTDINVVKVDGGDASREGDETEGDIETVLSLAPKANILVYEAPNSEAGAIDDYNEIVSQDVAKVVSISWGECEADLGQVGADAEDSLFEEAAAQGQTVLVASGDGGSEDCGGSGMAVDDPASQPYVTGVGGTEWLAAGTPPSEEVWNSVWGASGGGVSSFWPMPSYQSDASAPGVISRYSSGAPCRAPSGSYCREVPDVSALAGVFPYVTYLGGSWTAEGGTSLAAPVWASLIALTNASSSCNGKIIGFANPVLYKTAGSDPNAFHDVTVGDNDYTQTNGGLYPATAGYDMATGLGTPNGALLPQALCADPITVTDPGTQSSDVGQSVNLQVTANDSTSGQTLTYSAVGLPAGLSIGPSSGLIAGAPSTSGSSAVVLTAKDATGASDSITFDWLVAPSVTRVDPTYGPGAGGTKVKLSGQGFGAVTRVIFGSVTATSFSVNKQGTLIKVVAPAGTGVVHVTVAGSTGTSPAGATSEFSYTPSVARVAPASGTDAGGTSVVITGTNFSDVSGVEFGSTPARFTVVTSRKIQATAPAGTPGVVNVTVTSSGGTSPVVLADEYDYS